LDPAAKKR